MTAFFRLEYPDPNDYYYSSAGAIPGLPVDYAWMNNDPIGGVRAAADGAQGGGHAEDGTMFVAYKNDAMSPTANRAHQALAVGMDLLDSQLRRPIAVPTKLDGSTGGSTLASVTIPPTEMVWLGPSGTEYSSLFQLVDSDGNEITDTSGTTCTITASTPPPGDAGLKNGFADVAVQLTISPAIPASTTYRIYYTKKGSLAELPRDAITGLAMGGRVEVSGEVKKVLAALHGSSPDWNAAWDSTVYDMSMSGLHERYNRQTEVLGGGQPEPEMGWHFDTPGSGSWIQREGYAPAVYPEISAGYWKDPIEASWKAVMRYASSDTRMSSPANGFVYFGGDFCRGGMAGSPLDYTPTVSSFMHVGATKMWGSDILYANAYTYVAYDCDCSVGYDATDEEVYVDISSPYRFHNGTNTDIQTGIDVLETYSLFYGRRALLVQKLKTSTRAYLRRLDGTKPGSIGTYAAKLRWHPMRSYIGDSAADTQRYLGLTDASGLFGAMIMGPRQHGTMAGPGQGGSSSPEHALRLLAGTSANLTTTSVLEWGHKTSVVDVDGYASPTVTGRLLADGDAEVRDLDAVGDIRQVGAAKYLQTGGGGLYTNLISTNGISAHVSVLDDLYASSGLYTNEIRPIAPATKFTLFGAEISGPLSLSTLAAIGTDITCDDNLVLNGLTSVKEFRHIQGATPSVSLVSNQAVTWSTTGVLKVTVSDVPTPETARTLTININGSGLEDYGIYYVSIGSTVAFNQGGGANPGISSLVVTFIETSSTGRFSYGLSHGSGVTAGTFTLNQYPNLLLRLTKVPHAYSGTDTYTVYIEIMGTQFIGAI